ncbi:hypothetical protein [Undibacterium pigrum]|uniref:Uncharacterized protein n=1 Tax=Undibacterium pigrum TaxID=401470 RepID=A0A318IMU9_9BURK|nr:hypothetical protein [Undibacterium pigrum]PXX33724.1 hypothetical protein DFR42_12920 [Undibacterium pigrum]
MTSSNQTPPGKLKTLRILKAVVAAGLYAAIFLPALFFSLFCIVLTVGSGNEFANALVNFAGKIIEVPLRMLNMGAGGGIFPASFFWSLVLYAVVFLRVFFFTRVDPLNEIEAAKRYDQMKAPAILSLLFLLTSLAVLAKWE